MILELIFKPFQFYWLIFQEFFYLPFQSNKILKNSSSVQPPHTCDRLSRCTWYPPLQESTLEKRQFRLETTNDIACSNFQILLHKTCRCLLFCLLINSSRRPTATILFLYIARAPTVQMATKFVKSNSQLIHKLSHFTGDFLLVV